MNLFTGGGGYLYIEQMAKGAVFIASGLVFGLIVGCLMIVMASAGLGFTSVRSQACLPLVRWAAIAIVAA